jgi:hypothetical protein
MAGVVAAERLRRPQPVPGHEDAGAVEAPSGRGTDRTLRRTTVASAVLVVTSLLVVAGANAYLTQGEVQLTRVQEQLTAALGTHAALEQQVSTLGAPSAVVAQAQRHGLVAPQKVTDLPQVTVPLASATTTTAVPVGRPTTTSTGAR